MSISAVIYQWLLKTYHILPFKKDICLLLRALPFNHEKYYRDTKFNGIFKTRVDKEELRLVHYSSTIENEIFWKGIDNGWEKNSIKYWKLLSKQSSVIFDIGANTGIYSLIAAKLNQSAKVYGFEPSKNIYTKFEKNVALNKLKNVHCFYYALSDKNDTAKFYDLENTHTYSASLNREMLKQNSFLKETIVPVKKIATFIQENNLQKIDLMKIDVEMHELEVLAGMENYLRQFKPSILLEVLKQETAIKISQMLENMTYCYFDMNEKNAPVRLPAINRGSADNILLCQEEVARQIGLL
ncbi:MAG: FkbM family methyltransferase [Chitinophagales bacterium]|nr:FkbM family methyltransferase [Chitinophagales bacterium]